MKILAKATDKSPSVVLDGDVLTISGRSYMSNTRDYYNKINALVDAINQPKLDVVFSFDHFNSTSSKCLLELIRVLETKYSKGVDVKVIWQYRANYFEMLEAGEDFRDVLEGSIPFELQEVPEED